LQQDQPKAAKFRKRAAFFFTPGAMGEAQRGVVSQPPIIKIGQVIGRNIGHGIALSHALFHHCMQSHHDHRTSVQTEPRVGYGPPPRKSRLSHGYLVPRSPEGLCFAGVGAGSIKFLAGSIKFQREPPPTFTRLSLRPQLKNLK
jgi:hypothetical protein